MITFLTGSENLIFQGRAIGKTVSDYWSWSYSDLYNNIYRGILAEYIVASALSLTPPEGDFRRTVWDSCDMISPSGKRIEVKSSAYLQSRGNRLAKISFGIAPTRKYDDATQKLGTSLERNNDVYVFCLFKAKSKDVSPLNLDYWDFYVLPTATLNEYRPNQKTITLRSLLRLSPILCGFDALSSVIESI